MVANSPEQIQTLFGNAARARDIDAMIELYEIEPLLVDFDGQERHSSDALYDMLNDTFSRLREFTSQRHRLLVKGDLALISSQWHAQLTTAGGSQPISGTSVEVARRQPNGAWLLVIDDPRFLPGIA